MRSFLAFVLAALLVALASAQTPVQFPNCSNTCLGIALPKSICEPTDVHCICTNKALNDELRRCVQSSCSIRDSLRTQNVTASMCEWEVRDKTLENKIIAITFVVLAFFAVIGRVASKLLTSSSLWWDDYFIIVALIISIPTSALSSWLSTIGLCTDIWTVPFENINKILYVYYIMELLYVPAMVLVKNAITMFLYNIFKEESVRRILYLVFIFNILWGISFQFSLIFQCTPVSYAWTRWDGEHKGKCIDLTVGVWLSSLSGISVDIAMLAISIWKIFGLQMRWRKKIAVTGMLVLGTFVTVVSILRLQTLANFGHTTNPTWDLGPAGYWSMLEVNVGIICSSLPAIRLLINRYFPRSSIYSASKSNGSSNVKGSGGRRNEQFSFPTDSEYSTGLTQDRELDDYPPKISGANSASEVNIEKMDQSDQWSFQQQKEIPRAF